MWGDYILIKFYPKNWQGSMFRSMQPLLVHTTVWHYWLVFTFTISMNLFFIFLYKSLIHQRADIRGTRSTGEKRRIAWPEMLIVIVPFYWAINVVINALTYLRIFEGTCGNIILSVQINAFQWGWKYCYDDTFYAKYLNTPVRVGYKSTVSLLGSGKTMSRSAAWNLKNDTLYEDVTFIYYGLDDINIRNEKLIDVETTEAHRWKKNVLSLDNSDTIMEVYFCRFWLKNFGNIENELNNKTLNKKWQHGYWITSQGLDANTLFYNESYNEELDLVSYNVVKDPLRLLRASNALVLPTRSNVRLMACSDDITHSWAVPALGLKMDCVPGRVFCIYLNIIREGIYYGQCSELCGWNHYNMPIVVYALPAEHFVIWWEMELHSSFNKKYFNPEFNTETNYKLINYKYK